MENSDNAIISKIHAGEAEAFTALYEKYVDKIYAFIYYKTHHKQVAEDLTSQTFMKALEKIQQFQTDKGTFQAWLYQIARNNVIDHYRSFKPASDIEDAWDLSTAEDIERDVDLRSQLAEIQKGLETLTAAQRDIVILRVWQGLSYAEIAEIVDKSAEACKVDFSRASGKLRKEFALVALIFFLSI
jgi:RNA polymerase sigma-70 factor (ECF subfamily)